MKQNGRLARLTRRLPVLLVAAGLAVAATPPALAAVDRNPAPGTYVLRDYKEADVDCPAGWMCIYDHRDFAYDSFAMLPGTGLPNTSVIAFNDGQTGFTSGFRSWNNQTAETFCRYSETDFKGTVYRMPAFSKDTGSGSNGNVFDKSRSWGRSFGPCPAK